MPASTTETFSVEAIVDLLNSSTASDYSNAGSTPSRIGPIYDFSHNDRIQYPDPALYVWQPTDADIQKFSMDGDNQLEDEPIEVLIMTLDKTNTKNYQRDVLNILSQYYNDTESNTPYYTINPQNKSDLRNEHMVDITDHYLATVQIEGRRYADAGV